MKTVSRYNLLGFLQYLPSLNIGRHSHGCGAYLGGDGTKVSKAGKSTPVLLYHPYFKVFIVAGGWDTNALSSTEVLPSSSSEWVVANPLPKKLYSMKGVTIADVFYITGKFDDICFG